MDTWKFYDITHREHVVCNPTSDEKLTRLVEILRLPTDAQVVERVEKARATYLRWGRDTLGWAIYMFRRRTPRLPSGTSLD